MGEQTGTERPSWASLRAAVAASGTALAAVLAALLLGEYDFSGGLPWLAGPVLGIVLAEVATALLGDRSRVMGVLAGALAAGALLWASYIATGEGLEPIPGAVWPSMALAVAAAFLWVGGLPVGARRRPPEEHTEQERS